MSIKLKGSTDGSVTLQAPADTSPTGTDKTLILPTGVGSANQILRNGSTAGTLEFAAIDRVKRTYSTQELSVTGGETELEFTGIPANVLTIRLVFRFISLGGSNNLEVQVGHAASGGTYFTSGYFGCSNSLGSSSTSGTSGTAGLRIRGGSNNVDHAGIFELVPDKVTSPTRFYSFHALNNTDSNNTGAASRFGTGMTPDISSVTIDRIKLKPTSTNAFDDTNGRISLITEVME